jgi:geranylgeranyl pyrophosphate synthase
MSRTTGVLKSARFQAGRLSAETYTFIEKQILPGPDWTVFDNLLRDSREKWSRPPFVHTDIFPALACQAAGGDPFRAVPLAAAWLLYTLAGRIFDDLQDSEGEQQPWMRSGAVSGVSIGLFAVGAANAALSQLLVDRQTLSDVLNAFGNVLALAAKAQTTKLDLKGLTAEQYFAHIAAKTGIVFATGAWAGARVAEPAASAITTNALYDFGLNLGMAIQIADDCEDLGISDLQHRHFTLPVIFALGQEGHPQHPKLKSLLEYQPGENWAKDTVGLLTEMGAIEWSLHVASAYRAKAMVALEPLPQDSVAALIAFIEGNFDTSV